jgi:CRP/FNR family cyclic AMP-dependent transcriptional regulator
MAATTMRGGELRCCGVVFAIIQTYIGQRVSSSVSTNRQSPFQPSGKKRLPRARKRASFNPEAFLEETGVGRTLVELKKNEVLFSQGDEADAVFFLQKGTLKLTVVSQQGKEATVALLQAGNFVGEACVAAAERIRTLSATALTRATLMRIKRAEMIRVLHEEHAFSDVFVSFLLARNVRIQADLVDQLFNSSEKRLARILLLLANFGKEGKPESVVPKISQEVLAEMIGTTRSRVNFFMNRFRKLGFINYNGHLEVHSSLLNVILHD